MADALGDLDATGIAAAIKSRDISAQEALDAAIARAERLNGELNFMASKAFDYARARAAAPGPGPFAGVPTLIKDLLPIAGLPAKFGCRAMANFIAPEQSPYADALIASGLVPFAKSTTPEFGLTATTEPLLGGPTRNPWDPSKSSGGSSGGAAVAVAARVAPIAHASDGGGSIRIPASCNGLFGLKVSRGRTLASNGLEVGISLSVNGCVSLSVRDSATWFAVTEDKSGPLAPVGMVGAASNKRLRIGLCIADARGRDPDAEVRHAIEDAAGLCRSLGHSVRDVALPADGAEFADAFTMAWAALASNLVKTISQMAPGTPREALFEPLTLGLAANFDAAPSGDFEQKLKRLVEVEARYSALFDDIDVLLTPVLASTPPAIGEIGPQSGMDGFAKVERYVGYTPLQNVAGAPAMSVPLNWSAASGMPIGAHFSAAKGQERTLLELAYELELARPWIGRKPRVNAG